MKRDHRNVWGMDKNLWGLHVYFFVGDYTYNCFL